MRFNPLIIVALVCAPVLVSASVKKPIVEVKVNDSAAPEMTDWSVKAKKFIEKWYPVIVKRLVVKGYEAPTTIDLELKDNEGVGGTGKNHIEFSIKWVKAHPDDFGPMVFMLAHVAQDYPKYDPTWLVDGVAEYCRYRVFNDKGRNTTPDPAKHNYKEGYWTVGAFLVWMEKKYDKKIVSRINEALRKDEYTPDFWKAYKGKSIDELWADYTKWYSVENDKNPHWAFK